MRSPNGGASHWLLGEVEQKRLGRGPLKAETGVRFPQGAPEFNNLEPLRISRRISVYPNEIR